MERRENDAPRIDSSHLDFICGWSAGCIETCILFPIVKITFRQQLHNVRIPVLYRGLLPPLIQRTTTRMIMFGMYDTYKKAFGCTADTNFSMCHAYSAFLAGTTEAILCPLERVQVLLQTSAYNHQFKNTGNAFKHVSAYGLREFYRGFSLIVVRNGLSNTLFFTIRVPLQESVFQTFSNISKNIKPTTPSIITANNGANTKDNKFLVAMSNFISGAVLGASISTLFFPINNRIQSVLGTPFMSPLRVFKTLLAERNHSLKELYRGVHLNYTRSLLTWGITNTVYELLKDFFYSIQTSRPYF